jgi:uncharacterized protein
MKISVSKIPDGGMNLRFEKDEAWFRERLLDPQTEGFVVRGIAADVAVRRMKDTVFVEGTATAEVEMPCCRCLEPTRLPLGASFKYTFAPPPDQTGEEWELTAEDLDFAYYQDDMIDLDDIVFEQVLLQVPIKPLCAESCKGLCPQCGGNLNAVDCQCRIENTDARLGVLKTFKVQS